MAGIAVKATELAASTGESVPEAGVARAVAVLVRAARAFTSAAVVM